MQAGDTTPSLTTSAAASHRRARRRGRRTALLGVVLLAYGLLGIGIFAFVATAINRPLERVRQLSEAVEAQRTALIASMEEAEDTIRGMSNAVRNMGVSLTDAQMATDRSSGIASGVATSMFALRDQMTIEIPLVGQPFLGLYGSFDQAGQQLQLLSTDLATIGTSLNTNRTDVITTATNLVQLADSVEELARTVRGGPTVEITEEAIETFRLALFAIAGWVVLFAIGCVLAGLYLMWRGWRTGKERVGST